MTTSTPAHVHHAAHINTVGGTSVSACSLEVNKTLKVISILNHEFFVNVYATLQISSDIGESQTELIFARLLQASYLDITVCDSLCHCTCLLLHVQSARSLRLQEDEAKV